VSDGTLFDGCAFDPVLDGPLGAGAMAAESCADAAERRGWDREAAGSFILDYLAEHGPTPGEVLVTKASQGNSPPDARAFGAVFMTLCRRKLIEKCGYTRRSKGHGTHGGLVWRLARS
jgi:hypothetical protein